MTVGGVSPGTGAFMSYTTDQLREENALGDYALSEEEEAITITQAPSSPVPPAVSRQGQTSASSGGE